MATEATATIAPLVAYAWPGGYPVFYLDRENAVLCPECAQSAKDDGETLMAAIHWEGPDLFCDECGAAIESAYGDPEGEA